MLQADKLLVRVEMAREMGAKAEALRVSVRDEALRCEGAVLQRGRRTALAEARLYDAAGKLAAHATSSCLIFDATA